MQVKKRQLELDTEQQTGSKSGKEYVEAVYCHPGYLTYTQSISYSGLGEETQAGIKNAGRNVNNLRYANEIIWTLIAENEEELKSLLMKMKEKGKNVGLKLNIQKN